MHCRRVACCVSLTDWHAASARGRRLPAGLLLDVWTRLLSQMQFRAAQDGGSASERVDGAVRDCAREVFAELLKAQLAEYAAGADAEAVDDGAAVRGPLKHPTTTYHAHILITSCTHTYNM